ncbi:MAG: C-type lectin domain-containing protein [Kofleriaceae bacterium]
MRWICGALAGLAACAFDPREGVAPDAARDAPAPLVCPPRFDRTLAGSPSHYYLEPVETRWRAAEQACEAMSGHLFVPDDDLEADAMRALLSDDDFWVGLVQKPAATASAEWFTITGAAMVTTRWDSTKPDDGGQENGEEQVAVLDDSGLDDKRDNESHRSICECDGKPIDTTLVALIPQ